MTSGSLTKTADELLAAPYVSDFFRPWNNLAHNPPWARPMTIPAVNVKDNADSYELSVAAPGLKKEDFDVSVKGKQLTISAEQQQERETKQETFTRKEYNFTSFTRTFLLPDEVEPENIEATYKEGELIVTLPKTYKKNDDAKTVVIR